jgi:integrase
VVLSYGVEECGCLHDNPALKVVKFNEGSSRNRVLTPEEVQRLLDACRQSRCKALYPLIFLATRTGCRLGELESLEWSDVSFDQSIIFIRTTKNGQPRSVPLSEEAKAVLQEVFPESKRCGRVFKGRRLGGKVSVRKPFYTALSVAGITGLRIHDLRHLFCTTAARNGSSILQIQAITGHRTTQMLNRYAHLEGAQLKHIVDNVDKALNLEKRDG